MIGFFSIVILSILGDKMNKLYLALIGILCGSSSISAEEIDYRHIRPKGNERIILFTDSQGKNWMAATIYRIDRNLLARALEPKNNVYDLRELQRALPFFRRFKGTLGLAAGLIMGAVGLHYYQKFNESPEIADHC